MPILIAIRIPKKASLNLNSFICHIHQLSISQWIPLTKMNSRFIILLLIVTLSVSCKNDPKSILKPLDLHPYGIPVKIMAPDSAIVSMKDYSIMKDITVQKDDWYYVQIFQSTTSGNDTEEIKRNQLESVRQDKNFKEIVREDESGFIYEKQLSNDQLAYDFRYIKIIGDQEIIFQTGITGIYTLENVEIMYESVCK